MRLDGGSPAAKLHATRCGYERSLPVWRPVVVNRRRFDEDLAVSFEAVALLILEEAACLPAFYWVLVPGAVKIQAQDKHRAD